MRRLKARKRNGFFGPLPKPVTLLKLVPELRAVEIERWDTSFEEWINDCRADVYPHGEPTSIGMIILPAGLPTEFAHDAALAADLEECKRALAIEHGHLIRKNVEFNRRHP